MEDRRLGQRTCRGSGDDHTEAVHISVELTPENLVGAGARQVPHFDGAVRAKEIGDLYLQFPKPTGPFVVYIDNIRLIPKDG